MGKRGHGGMSTVEEFSIDMDAEDLEARLRARFLNPSYRPPLLPRVALELMRLSRRPDVDLDDVVGGLAKDPMLAGRVLRAASSPLFMPSSPSRELSLREAVMRLGMINVRDVVLEVVLNIRIFRAKQYARELGHVARHGSAAGLLARILARRAGIAPELAFLVGLFHDVGFAGCLLALGDEPEGSPVPHLGGLWPALDAVHAEMSAAMIELWGLPAELREAASQHRGLAAADTVAPLAALACLAEHLANRAGWTVHPREGGDPIPIDVDAARPQDVERARHVLGLDGKQMKSLENAARLALQQLSAAG